MEGGSLIRGLTIAKTVLLLLIIAGALPALAESGCVGCHTDEAALRKLFVPPKAAVSEGEG